MAAPTRRVVGLALLTLAIGLAIVAVTILPGAATPAVNLTSTTLARGTDQSNGTLTFQRGTDVVVVMNTFAAATATTPPGSSGWHSHPGGAIVVVAQGEITLYRSVGGHCDATTYTAGRSFLERPNDVQDGVNTGSIDTIVYVTFPGVPAGGSPRIDVPTDPGTCPGI
ncbi:MAG: cupin domain-containing protein [Actinobacteria bacterium]|nr:MAG: cupin domain-containing protein [Actinomycetota bacterium]